MLVFFIFFCLKICRRSWGCSTRIAWSLMPHTEIFSLFGLWENTNVEYFRRHDNSFYASFLSFSYINGILLFCLVCPLCTSSLFFLVLLFFFQKKESSFIFVWTSNVVVRTYMQQLIQTRTISQCKKFISKPLHTSTSSFIGNN